MTDVVEFLTARLNEDEAAIKAMGAEGAGRWWVGQRFDGSLDPEGSTVFVDVRRSDGLGYIHLGTPGVFAGPTAIHIARHDPARVLAEVAAKRARLALYVEVTDILFHGGLGDRIKYQRESGRFEALNLEVRRDAALFASHPDYDPAWKPTP